MQKAMVNEVIRIGLRYAAGFAAGAGMAGVATFLQDPNVAVAVGSIVASVIAAGGTEAAYRKAKRSGH